MKLMFLVFLLLFSSLSYGSTCTLDFDHEIMSEGTLHETFIGSEEFRQILKAKGYRLNDFHKGEAPQYVAYLTKELNDGKSKVTLNVHSIFETYVKTYQVEDLSDSNAIHELLLKLPYCH